MNSRINIFNIKTRHFILKTSNQIVFENSSFSGIIGLNRFSFIWDLLVKNDFYPMISFDLKKKQITIGTGESTLHVNHLVYDK